MSTQSPQTCLSPELLKRLDHNELSPADLIELEEHISGCDRCRDLLDVAQSDPQWQSEIVPILQARSELLRAHVDHDDEVSHESESLQSILRLLGPTDDPHMLGRIGPYEIVGVIGRGGMGVVFKAYEGALNRFVAIKMLLPHLAASGAARKRFAREGQAAAAVIDDNVMPIYSVAEWQGVPYLVTQYSRGTTLQKRIQDQGPLELKEILRIGMQTARGLAAAHAQGLVHRDVKPSNILLDGTVERALLTDFGLARAVDDASITKTGTIAGTPQYMSPEQARAGSVDSRSDLFGLGCVMYAMCTGRPPFRAESSYAVMRLITDHEPHSIRDINADIPAWLCAIIYKLMSKQAADRYATATEVADLLETCLAHVQQPASVSLPEIAVPRTASRRSVLRLPHKGWIAMLGTIGMTLLGMVLWQASEPPDIAGQWISDEWGTVVLEAKQAREYEGSFSGSDKIKSGTVHLKWSRVERRFNGSWGTGDDRGGRMSIRLVDNDISGAWTANKSAEKASGTPRLGDLLWTRSREPAGEAVVKLGVSDPFIFDAPGSFELHGGVSLEIVAREHDEAFGKVYRAVFHWPANGEFPALRYEVDIASDKHRQWAVAGKMDAPVVWLIVEGQFQSGSNIRAIDYSTPANIITSTVYGDDRFDLKIPELDEVQQSRRIAFSIGGQGQQIPKDLDAMLVKRFGHGEPMKYGISSLLPTGLHHAGGQHAEAAVTEDQWTFSGCVRTPTGHPVPHVVVTARDEYHPTIAIASATTDDEGRYQLRFRSDVYTLMNFRSVTIEPRLEGLAERNAASRTEFSLRLARDEDPAAFSRRVSEELKHSPMPRDRGPIESLYPEREFSGRVAVLGERTRADFVMPRQDETSRVEVHYIGDLSIWDRRGRSQQIGLLCKYLGVATGESTAVDTPYVFYDAARMSLLVRASAAKHQEIIQQLDALRENRVGPAEERLNDKLTKAYRIAGLPLWSKDGKNQDATLLIRYLRAALDPAWKNQATRAVYDAEELSLVVFATADVHDKIAYALTQLEESPSDVGDARLVADAYVAAVLAGRVAEAASLAKGSPAGRQQIEPLSAILNQNRLYVNDPAKPTKALAISETATLDIKADSGNIGRLDGFLVLTLSMTEEGWFVTEVAHQSKVVAEGILQRFIEANPRAVSLPPRPDIADAERGVPANTAAKLLARLQGEWKAMSVDQGNGRMIGEQEVVIRDHVGIVKYFQDGKLGVQTSFELSWMNPGRPEEVQVTFDPNSGDHEPFLGLIECDGKSFRLCCQSETRPRTLCPGDGVFYIECTKAVTPDLAPQVGVSVGKTKFDRSALPRVSDNLQSSTTVLSRIVSGGGIIERIEGDTVHFRSGDRIHNPAGTMLVVPEHGESPIAMHNTDLLEPGMAIAYSIRDGKVEKLFLIGIVEQTSSAKSAFDTITELKLQKGVEVTDSIDGRNPIRITGKGGEVSIKIGQTKLIQLPRLTESVEWRAGEFTPEGIDDIEPFDYVLVQWRDNGRITFTCYASPPKEAQGGAADSSQGPELFPDIEKPLDRNNARLFAMTMFRIQPKSGAKVIVWSPDGSTLAVGSDRGVVSLYDGTNGAQVGLLRLLTDEELAGLDASNLSIHAEVRAMEFSPDSNQLAVGDGLGQVKLFNVSTGKLIRAFDDEQAKLAETQNPDILNSLRRGMGSVASLAFSPDGSLLATCGGSFADFSRATDSVERMGRKVTGPDRLKVWEVNTGAIKHDLTGHSAANMVAFSSDGSLLASAGRWSDNSNHGDGVLVWNPHTGEKLRTISLASNGGTHTAVFSPNGKKLLIGSRHFDKENDTSTTTISLAYALSGVTEWQQTLDDLATPKVFSPDGKSVVLLSSGQSIRVMDAETGAVKKEIQSANFPPDISLVGGSWNEISISPDGARLAIGGVDSKKQNFVDVTEFSFPVSSSSH